MWARYLRGANEKLVGREGIEPPQSKTADLQSAELTTCSTYPRAAPGELWLVVRPRPVCSVGADDGTRTRNLRFTKPLLYQLSYVGMRRRTMPQAGPVAPANDRARVFGGSSELSRRPKDRLAADRRPRSAELFRARRLLTPLVAPSLAR